MRNMGFSSQGKVRRAAYVGLVASALLIPAAIIAGCGSSATTSSADANAVAAAEQELGAANRRTVVNARGQCSEKSGQAEESCFQKLIARGEEEHRRAFVATIDKVLESGVGPECAEALEEALSTVGPDLFLGGTASVCRSESRN